MKSLVTERPLEMQSRLIGLISIPGGWVTSTALTIANIRVGRFSASTIAGISTSRITTIIVTIALARQQSSWLLFDLQSEPGIQLLHKQLSLKISSLGQAHSSAHASSALPNAPRLGELCRIPRNHRQFSWLVNANAQKVTLGIQTFSFSIFFFNSWFWCLSGTGTGCCFEKCMEPKLKFPFNGSPSPPPPPPHLQWKTFSHTSWNGGLFPKRE